MDVIDLARYLGALFLVLALVGFAALAARRYGLAGFVQGTVQRRLAIVETMMVGPRHKILLIRRDGTEHLVLMGPQGANVIESGIPAPVRDTSPSAAIEAVAV
jgi:flagellar protein FliO/FliZ